MRVLGWTMVFALVGCGGSSKPAPAEPSNTAAESQPAPDKTLSNQEAAESDAARAAREADEARAKVDRLLALLEELDKKVSTAVEAVVDAQNDADRQAAANRLKQLQREQAELKQRVAEARAESEKAERKKGTKISKECMDNPLAKGCE